MGLNLSERELSETVATMRALGVRVLAAGDVRIELGPVPVVPVDAFDAPQSNSPACPCEHDVSAHDANGLCFHGCAQSDCAKKV